MAEFLCPSKVTHIIEACSRKALSLASLQELSRATQQRLQDLDQVTWRLQSAWLSKGNIRLTRLFHLDCTSWP